jgi:hypothetical protein
MKFAMVLLLNWISFLALSDEISAAFGITLGQKIPENVKIDSCETNGNFLLSFFKTADVKYIEEIAIASYIDTGTNFVAYINGYGKFDSEFKQQEAYEVLKDVISKKYLNKNSRFKESLSKNKFKIEQGARSVEISKIVDLKRFPLSYRIAIIYADEILCRKLVESDMERKSKDVKINQF